MELVAGVAAGIIDDFSKVASEYGLPTGEAYRKGFYDFLPFHNKNMISWRKLEEGCPEVLPASIYGVPKSGYLNKQGQMHLIEDTSQLDIGKLKKVYVLV